MLRLCALQRIRTGVAHFEQQRSRLMLHEGEDGAVHLRRRRLGLPAVLAAKGIEGPEAFVVTLGGDDGLGGDGGGEAAGQLVGAADVARHHRNDKLSGTVDTDNRRVLIFILQSRRDTPHANPHRPDENHRLEFLPMRLQKRRIRPDSRASVHLVLRVNPYVLPVIPDLKYLLNVFCQRQ